ncbi:hypothetical protein Clacol_007096 [Clathrus columnatus]|uniref:Major facilitator superfamily (MFS) profile domain-containing protein n=1 Tax=Clathrus columnatus TaxID=1419009 RepID=A0AAV5AIU2_9AGAM|nr:hypothetical protein Clacol_007096 [Clathrus columnatus]
MTTLGNIEPPSGRLWRTNSLNLNISILKRFSTRSITAEEQDTGLQGLWRPNALNLNVPIRSYSLESMAISSVSTFGVDNGSTSKLLGEDEDTDETDMALLPAGFVLFFGKVITISPPKVVLLVCIVVFELGSLFCAIAPSVGFLIFGRAVAGAGASGIWIAITSILTRISTLKQRPILMGLIGAVFAICNILGPLLGGVFVAQISFHGDGAFVGGVGTAVIIFTLPNFSIINKYYPISEGNTFLQRHKQLNAWFLLDWIGIFLSFSSVTLVLLGLQAGGNTKPWNDGAVIAPLVLGLLLFIGFGFWESHQGSRAIVPIALLKRRNVLGACVQMPLLYQLRGHSAEKSGSDILPYMISGIITSLTGSAVTTVTGHIWFLIAFPQILAVVVFGLLSTTKADTSFARLTGFQILLGVGLGAGINNPTLIAQAEFVDDPEAASLATSLVAFCEVISSAINLAVNGAILSGILHSQISKLAGDLSPALRTMVLESITFVLTLPDNIRGRVIDAYITAIDRVFLASVIPTAVSMFTAFIVERKRISLKQT